MAVSAAWRLCVLILDLMIQCLWHWHLDRRTCRRKRHGISNVQHSSTDLKIQKRYSNSPFTLLALPRTSHTSCLSWFASDLLFSTIVAGFRKTLPWSSSSGQAPIRIYTLSTNGHFTDRAVIINIALASLRNEFYPENASN